MDKVFIGKKIQELRKAKGFSQAKLAELVDLHEKHISRIESGKSLLSSDNLLKICSVLEYDVSQINELNDFIVEENPEKTRLLKIINNASDKELQFYLGLIEQAQKGLRSFK